MDALRRRLQHLSLNESPFEKEGKFIPCRHCLRCWMPSMKVPPKRKGNPTLNHASTAVSVSLNESPSEKEGKSNQTV